MGWTVRGSNSGGGEIFCTCPDWPWGPPSLLYNGYRVFPGGKERPGRDADPSPPSSAVGHERVELYLYSPYSPYGLYRASVPVQGCTLKCKEYINCRSAGKVTVGRLTERAEAYYRWSLVLGWITYMLQWLDKQILFDLVNYKVIIIWVKCVLTRGMEVNP